MCKTYSSSLASYHTSYLSETLHWIQAWKFNMKSYLKQGLQQVFARGLWWHLTHSCVKKIVNKTACGTKIANMRYVSLEVHLSVGRDAPKCRRRLSMASSSPSSRFSSIFRPNSAPKFFFAFSSDVLFDNLGLNIPIFQGSRTCVGNCIFFAIVVHFIAINMFSSSSSPELKAWEHNLPTSLSSWFFLTLRCWAWAPCEHFELADDDDVGWSPFDAKT